MILGMFLVLITNFFAFVGFNSVNLYRSFPEGSVVAHSMVFLISLGFLLCYQDEKEINDGGKRK